jgi:hypothetical protein
MSRSLLRQQLLVVAFGLTALLPVVTVVQMLTGASGPISGNPIVEPFLVALELLSMTNAAVGITIVWRRPGNRVGALLLAGALLFTSVAASWWWVARLGLTSTGSLQTALTWWAITAILPAVFVLFPTVGVYFPDGRLPGPRWRAPYAVAAAALVAGLALQTIAPAQPDASGDVFVSPFAIPGIPSGLGDIGAVLSLGAVLAALVMAVGSVVVRYRRSAGVERAQVKWLVAAVVLISVLFPVSYLLEFGPDGLLDVVSVLAGCLIPIAVGVAVLRYRLYDIDRLISRTLSWAIVTGGVVLIFALLVVGLQGALAGLTQGETLAVALSTIVAAALFQPVRRRVQGAVDRRFDRARYDGQRTIEAFAHEIRDEVDLPRLRDTLVATAHGAVRPAAATLWLRESSR